MGTTVSKWRRFRREFSQWASHRKREAAVTQASASSPPSLASDEQSEFDRLIKTYKSRDTLFDWAEAAVESAAEQRPLFAEGQILAGRFQIVRFLGRGGMGEVYEAENKTLEGHRVALKTLSAEVRQRPGAARRFIREVELAQRVTHPNICRIHDIFPFVLTEESGREEPGYFLTMQLLEGESLAKYLADRGTIPLEEALPILRAMADALDAAHTENVVHRDLKPGNIILVKRLGTLQPVITDFGLAGLVDRSPEADSEKSFAHFTRAGTPGYAAPEQIKEGRSGPASDIYSLGVVALEMLTGETSELGVETLPVTARKAIARCLSAEPAARFARAPDFVAALAGQPVKSAARGPKVSRRAAIGATAATVAGGAALAYLEFWRGSGHRLNTLSILPFELATPAASLPGFQEELVRTFLRSRKVRLIAPYSTSSLRGPFHIDHLAKMLPADGFLLGVISTRAIVVRLFHRNGSMLWEKSFPRSGADFDLHRTLVASVLKEIAGAAEARALTAVDYVPSEEGYRAYIAARAAVRGQSHDQLKQAEALFLEAIRHDGAFALAFSGLAYVLFLLRDRMADARAAAARSLALDPGYAEAHFVQGLILHRCDWDWEGASVELKKALDLEPYNFAVHQVYGGCLADRGFFDEGLPEMQTAVDYDPLSYNAKFGLGIMLTHARRFDSAINQLERGLATARAAKVDTSRPYSYLGACWLQKGEKEKAFRHYSDGLARQPDELRTICHYIFGAGQSGHVSEAAAKMEQLLQMPEAGTVNFYVAMAFAGLGNIQRALDYLEAAVQSRDPDTVQAKVHLYAEPLRAEPRYQAILRRLRLS